MSNSFGWRLDNSYARLPEVFFRRVRPTRVRAPRLVLLNRPLCAQLGLDAQLLEGDVGARIFAGNELPPGADPISQAYAGHQFGYFTFLGDGRAVILGEQITPSGERVDIALKGSGPTPFSRHGDGRAALAPMLREYIISEAMHYLGIPTTRSLAVVATGEDVVRDRFLPGAVLTRIAKSHIRVGTFQYFSARDDRDSVRLLADYTLERHFPHLRDVENPYDAMLRVVVQTQAELIAAWMLVGFVHGVMNTDNMSLAGETIDYGPCAFLDSYRPGAVFSSIDRDGRYAYANQPAMGAWNLTRLAESMLPLVAKDPREAVDMAQAAVEEFVPAFRAAWYKGMARKLGLVDSGEEDVALMRDWLALLEASSADFTNAFRGLMRQPPLPQPPFTHPDFPAWYARWQARVAQQKGGLAAAVQQMRVANPAVIARNQRVEEALAAAVSGDLRPLEHLLAALRTPFVDPTDPDLTAPAPEEFQRSYRTFCGT